MNKSINNVEKYYPIQVKNVVKKFGSFTAVDDVSFEVEEGEVFGWLGPNGAGKTTMIRMMLGLMHPTAGTLRVLGLDPIKDNKQLHKSVGYMSQQFTLYNDLTAWENIHFYGEVYGIPIAEREKRENEILKMAGLESNRNRLTAYLSGGWRQRLALGCAILHHPRLLFLDEPTAGVDPVSRRDFWQLIYGFAKTGTTVLVTTHYMDEAELCQRVGLISQGKLVALDSPANLKLSQMRGQVLEINVDNPEKAMILLKEAQSSGEIQIDEVALYGAQIHVVVPDVETGKKAITSNLKKQSIKVNSIDQIMPTLEDVFISSVVQPIKK